MAKKVNICVNTHCATCTRADRIEYADGFICSGIVLNLKPAFDIVRICTVQHIGTPKQTWQSERIALDEAAAKSAVLNKAIIKGLFSLDNYFSFRLNKEQ